MSENYEWYEGKATRENVEVRVKLARRIMAIIYVVLKSQTPAH